MGYVGTQVARVRNLVKKAFEEQATPPKVAFAIGLGVLVGTSPLVGFHAFVAVAIASVVKLNRVLTFLGTNVSFGPLMGVFVTSEVLLGSRLLGLPAPALGGPGVAQQATHALGAWWVGYAIVGPAAAVAAGVAGYLFAMAKAKVAASA